MCLHRDGANSFWWAAWHRFMLCLTSLRGDFAQEALDALRDAGHEQLPRGPAHVTLGEFTCASTEERLGRCQSGAWSSYLMVSSCQGHQNMRQQWSHWISLSNPAALVACLWWRQILTVFKRFVLLVASQIPVVVAGCPVPPWLSSKEPTVDSIGWPLW